MSREVRPYLPEYATWLEVRNQANSGCEELAERDRGGDTGFQRVGWMRLHAKVKTQRGLIRYWAHEVRTTLIRTARLSV